MAGSGLKTLDTQDCRSIAWLYGQKRDQSVLARAPTVQRVPGRPSEPSQDVSAMHSNGSVVWRLRADSPRGRLADVSWQEDRGARVNASAIDASAQPEGELGNPGVRD